MVSTKMAAQGDHIQEHFDVFVRLPSGKTAPLSVRYDMTIFELKSVIEFTVGIPVEIQNLSYKNRLLYEDDETLRSSIIIPGVHIAVNYPYGWEDLIEASLAGDITSVINDIYRHFDKSIVARRRSVVMFISSHKGYNFLVARMLSDGVNPNTQTATGRTSLHIASAMGMMNCVGLLLQHHASVDIHDKFGFTPQQLAVRCGQKEVESKLIEFRRIKIKWDGKTMKLKLPWPLATNFPPTNLGQSVTPVIDLQQLCISPGPEEIRLYPLPGQRPRSAVVKSSKTTPIPHETDMQENSETVLHKTGGRLDNDKSSGHEFKKSGRRRPKSAFIVKSDPSVEFGCVQSETNPKERIHLRGNESHANKNHNKVDFYQQSTLDNQENVCCFGGCHGCEYDSMNMKTEFGSSVLHKSSVMCHSHGLPNPVRNQDSALALGSSHTHESSLAHEPAHAIDPSCTHELSTLDSPHGRVSHLRDSPRVPASSQMNVRPIIIDRCQSGQTEEERIREATVPRFVSEKERFQLKYGKKRATDEENEHAFQQWLALKHQDAKDEKLIRKVRTMLNKVTGTKVEEDKEVSKEKSVRSTNVKAFDDWLMKKKKADVIKRRQASQVAKSQECRIARQGKTFNEWLKEKNRSKLTIRSPPVSQQSKRSANDTKRLDAQRAYDQWLKKKQCEELESLKASMRPQSASTLAEYTDGGPTHKTRIHSAQHRLTSR
ncbi:uncharacterized protein LOC117117205 [Anneissia japonica]|uniref:uncharacterized protein LOC117117205 n=1 Tax=Anneissia japonica TaxID=1529436 RepID=UPI0014258BB4|nr:uncharacterized protein LOC117117205 [Anneissia japonica]